MIIYHFQWLIIFGHLFSSKGNGNWNINSKCFSFINPVLFSYLCVWLAKTKTTLDRSIDPFFIILISIFRNMILIIIIIIIDDGQANYNLFYLFRAQKNILISNRKKNFWYIFKCIFPLYFITFLYKYNLIWFEWTYHCIHLIIIMFIYWFFPNIFLRDTHTDYISVFCDVDPFYFLTWQQQTTMDLSVGKYIIIFIKSNHQKWLNQG